MSFGDWDFFETGGVTQGLETTGALVGTSSLKVDYSSTDEWHGQLNSGESRGFTKGKIRTIMKMITIGFSASPQSMGVYCLSSAEDITAAGTDFYAIRVIPLASANVSLEKVTNGLSSINGTQLGTTQDKNFQAGQTITIELEWDVNIAEAGGTVLKVRTGSQLDFSDLSEVISVIDASSPYETGFAEGIYVNTSSSAGNSQVFFDNTEIFIGS